MCRRRFTTIRHNLMFSARLLSGTCKFEGLVIKAGPLVLGPRYIPVVVASLFESAFFLKHDAQLVNR